MKNKLVRLICMLLSLVISVSGLPAFAEDDFDIVVAEMDATAPLPTPVSETESIPENEMELVPAVTATPEPTADPTLEPTVEPTVEPMVEPTLAAPVEPTAVPTEIDPVAETEEPGQAPTETPAAGYTEEPVIEATAEPAENPTPESSAAPTEGPVIDSTSEPAPTATAVVQETLIPDQTIVPESTVEPENTPELTEEIVVAETLEPAEAPLLIQSVQELADALWLTVDELAAALEISAEELTAMSPEELTAIYEAVLEMRSGMMMMSVRPEFSIDENNQLIAYLGEGGAVVVPDGVTSIANGAFKDCAAVTSVELPASIVSIGEAVFAGCSALQVVVLPENLESIGAAAFMNCAALQEITIPNGTKLLAGLESTVDSYTFANCTSLAKVVLPEGMDAIGTGMFAQCTVLSEINIPDTIRKIEASAFAGCAALESIKLPVAVEEIADDVFAGCTSINVLVSKGSYAETYCRDREIPYSYFDSTAPDSIVPETNNLVIGVQEKVSVANCTFLPAGTSDTVNYSSKSSRVAAVDADGLVTGKTIGKTVIFLNTAGGLAAEINIEVKKAPTAVGIRGLRTPLGLNEELQLDYTLSSGSAGSVEFSSNDTAVVDFLPGNKLIAVGEGSAKITAKTYNGKKKTVDVQVKPEPKVIELSSGEIILGVNDTRVLKYTLDEGSAGAVSYTSSDPEVVEVSQDGKLTAVQPGTADITVQAYNDVSAICRVTVVSAPESIVLEASRKTIGVGEKLQLSAVMSPAETVSAVKYSSGNTKIATVNGNGIIVAKRTGKVTIKATTYNGKSSAFVVDIRKAPTAVSMVAERRVIGVGEETQLGFKLSSGSAGAASFRSLNEAIASVTPEGLLKGVAAGIAEIEVRTYNGKRKRVKFEVKEAPAEITPNQSEVIIGAGDSWTLGYALNEGSAGAVEFSSDTPAVVETDAAGKLRAHEVGEATIQLESYNHVTASTHVTVVPAPEAIELSASRNTIGIGEKLQMVSTVTPGATVGTVRYKSSNTKIITVNGSGIVVARRAGKATITATTYNGVSATFTIHVKKAPTAVSMVAARRVIGIDETLQLGYKLSSGSNGAVSFRSLNEDIATVTADGLLRGVSVGFANIEVRTYNGKYKRVKFEVKAAPAEIIPEKMEIVIGAGDSWQLGYSLNEGSAGAVGFTSDNLSVAVPDDSGRLYAGEVGEATITLETYNHVSEMVHVMVVPAPDGIELSADRNSIGIGEKLQLNAVVSPLETVGTIRYKSSNTKIATVNGNGILAAKQAGKVTITATTYNGLSAKFVVTVRKAPSSVNLVASRRVIGLEEELQLGYTVNGGSNGAASFRSLNEDIAIVTKDGLLKGIAVGRANIEVRTYNNKYKRVAFEVKAAPEELTPKLAEVVIGAGDSWTLGYTLNEGSAGAVSFVSNNPAVVAPDAGGKLYANEPGEAVITLETYNHVTAETHVTVVPAPETVELSAARKTIGIGEKLQLVSTVIPAATVGTIRYKTSNSKVATVNGSGIVVAKRAGKATITATTYNGLSAKFAVTVQKAPTSVSMVAERKVIGIDEELQLGYKLSSGSNGAVSFRSLNEDIAIVTKDGLLKGIAVGRANIEVRTYNNKYKRVTFEVKAAPEELTPKLAEVVIGAGDSWTLGYTLNEGSAGAVSFVSNNPAVVVPDAGGKLYANEPGEAVITLETYNHVTAETHVTVVPAPETVELSATRKTIGIGEKLQLVSTVIPAATVGTIRYKTSNSKVATVNGSGIVVAKRAGKATITATTYNGLSAKFVVTIQKAPTSVSLVAERKVIGIDEELQLGYKLSSGSNGAVSFRSLNEDIAIVTKDGLLKGIAVGTAAIEVRTYNGKYKRVNFQVKAAPTLIVPSKPEVSIGVKDTWVLGYALDENAAGGVQFASSDPAIADVDSKGKITAFAEGSADITVTTYNDVSAVCRVTVVPEPTSIDLSMVPTTIGLNEAVQIKPNLLPENTVSGLRFTSSKSSVLKVDANGLFVGKKVGTANIVVKAYNGVSATVKVRVVSAPTSIKIYTDRSNVAVGELFRFTAKLSNGSAGDYWFESSDESVIVVNPENGVAEAISEGEAVIRAVTYNKRKSEIRVKVLPEPTSMAIVPGYAAIGAGDTIPLAASINAGSTGTYEFESLNPEIASVGQYDGLVSAREPGTAKIAVRAYNGVSATMELNVLPAPEKIDLIEPAMNENGRYEFKIDKGASYQIAVNKGEYTKLDLSFTSDNPSIATVSPTGLITGRRSGMTMVTVSTYNGASAQIWVTVQLLTHRYPVKTIMHAMGAVNGDVYSNSKEAFLANYADGHRFFEVDFSYTSDKKLVLWHSWKNNRVSSKLKAGYVPTYNEFMKQKVFDKYTPLDLAALLELMDAYPDAYIFMDTKLTGASDVRMQYKTIVSTAKNMGLEHVLDRMVVMVYNKTMYTVVNGIHPFRQYVFMMYKTFSKAPTESQVRSIASFCHANSIEYISMWDYWWKPSFMDIAREYGLEVNLHTVNSTSKAKEYVEDGVSLITSDYLSIKGY